MSFILLFKFQLQDHVLEVFAGPSHDQLVAAEGLAAVAGQAQVGQLGVTAKGGTEGSQLGGVVAPL